MPFKRTKSSQLLAAMLIVGTMWALQVPTSASNFPTKRNMPPFLAGADLSLLTAMENQDVVYKDSGKAAPALQIFRAHGFNCVRLRLWVNPNQTSVLINNLAYTISLGKRVKRSGLLLLLDIHYSDSWADPGKQTKPAAWRSLPTDQLIAQVHDYTRDVVTAMRIAGAMPDIVQVGNEIIGGMLWPDGKNWGPGHDFVTLGRILKAGIQGVGDGSGNQRAPLIMIHIDRGGDWGGTKWFFDGIGAQGVPYDIIGESYYPQEHGALSGLVETLNNAAERYHKPIVVVETAYPSKNNSVRLTPGLAYPETAGGQLQFLQDLIAAVKRTPDGLGMGVCYWEPEWLSTAKYGSAWNTTALFDEDGNALPAIDAFQNRTPTK